MLVKASPDLFEVLTALRALDVIGERHLDRMGLPGDELVVIETLTVLRHDDLAPQEQGRILFCSLVRHHQVMRTEQGSFLVNFP